jgi:hypothetical protein
MRRKWMTFLLLVVVGTCPYIYAGGWNIDLTEYGYREQPQIISVENIWFANARYVDFDSEGNILVGFVVHDRESDGPQFVNRKWRVLKFSIDGMLTVKTEVATNNWRDNAVYGGSGGKYLLRTGHSLKLFSPDGSLLKEEEVPEIFSGRYLISREIGSFPSRRKFYSKTMYSLEVLSGDNLEKMASCTFDAEKRQILRHVSETSMLVESPGKMGPYRRIFSIGPLCGPSEISYEVPQYEGPTPRALLDDRRTVGHRGPPLVLLDKGEEVWSYDPGKRKYISRVKGQDESGKVFAMPISTEEGGSIILDIFPRTKDSSVVVFRTKDGKRLTEFMFKYINEANRVSDWAISADGKYIVIMNDTDLHLIPIPDGNDESDG